MAETDRRESMNLSSLPRAEPETIRNAETEAIETAMEAGKDRRIRRKAQDEQAEADPTGLAASSFEHDAREHSIRAGDVREGRTDQDVRDTRMQGRSRRRSRQDQAASKLMEGEGSPKESKLIYIDDDEGVPGNGMAGARIRRLAAAAAGETLHRKISDQEDENVGVEASHRAEMLSEDAARSMSARASQKLRERSSAEVAEREKLRAGESLRDASKKKTAVNAKNDAARTGRLNKFFQKQRYKRQYAAAKYAEQKGEQIIVSNARFTVRVKAALREAFA